MDGQEISGRVRKSFQKTACFREVNHTRCVTGRLDFRYAVAAGSVGEDGGGAADFEIIANALDIAEE